MKATERLLALYEIHDLTEDALVKTSRVDGLKVVEVSNLWRFHDGIEREIVYLEAAIPEDVRKKLHDGD